MANPSLQIGNDNWAIKEDNLLGYSTAGTRFVPQPITMTRGSAGTRVNPSGLVETVELLGSEEIDCGDFECATPLTYWDEVGNSSLVVGDYQGRTNVANINILGTANSDRIAQDFDYVSGVTYFISIDIYLVSGNFRCDTANSVVPYDFVNTSITGSWQTLTGYFTPISSGTNGLWLRSSQQVNQFYVSNISVKESTKNDLARVDYTDGTSSLLAEPMRTNEVNYSEDFSQWTPVGSHTEINNTTLSNPSGVSTVGLAEATTGTSVKYFIEAAVSTVKSTVSIYLKYNSHQWVQITGIGGKTSYANFDIQNGVLGSSSGGTSKITLFGDGWYRCELSESADQNGSNIAVALVTSGTSSRLSNTTLTGSIYMWGAQVEAGSYATSYIPTDGGTVTRNQDQYTKTGISDLINSEEGVLFVEMAALADDETLREITLSDGTGTGANYILIRFNSGGSNRIYTRVDVGGSYQYFDLDTSHTVTDMNKIAIKWKNADFSTFINGVEVGSLLSGSIFSSGTLNKLSLTSAYGGANLYAKVKQLQVFKTADIDLAALTS